MKKFKKKISRWLLITLCFSIIQIQSVKEVKAEGGLSVTNATAQELVNKLLGSGVTAANIKFTGADRAKGTFLGGNGVIGFDEGVILSSGDASYVVGPNDITSKTAENGQPGDTQLTSLAGVATNDAAILEFDFVPTSSVVSFQYVFSSEEYNEYANSNVNDTFAFFINGVNYALIPGTNTAVSINTVNGGNPLGTSPKNSQYYINNEDKHLNTQMDGLTVVFSVSAPVNQGVTNHIKMAIADGGDSSFDSNVFIKANSINDKIAQPGKLDITTKDNYDVTISRSGGSDGTVSVTWQALDGNNSIVKTGVVTFGDGETTKIINVPASTVKVKLINPTGGGTIGDASKEIIFADIPSSNTRPKTPGAFTAPILGQTFKGGDGITVTWGVSTDLENDPISYTLEFNNGSSWTQVYNGSSASYSFTNTSGLNTTNAQFRVKASDVGGYSDYVTSNIFTVDSQVPQTPVLSASITAPTNGDVTVTAAYPEDASVKQYRVGISGAWLNYTAPIILTSNNAVYARCQDAAGNWSDEGILDINNIDTTSPNTAVISNADKYTDSIWYNSDQTITASFTKTEGCDEKLQYKTDNSVWTDGESVDVNAEGKHIVSFRVIDALGRTSEAQTVNVNVDKSAPTNAKIIVKDKEFTSFLNNITFGLFFKETLGVTITADCGISGVDKIEYQKVSDAASYDPNATWTIGNSFSVSPDEKFIVYAKITDNAGNFVIINSDGIIVDASKPALELTPDADDWTKNNISVKVKVSDNLSGVKEVSYTTDEAVPQTGTVTINDGVGTITLTNEGQYKLTVTAIDNSLNEISETIDIKIDRTKPEISGAANSSSYFIGRVIKLTDNLGEITQAAYKNGTDAETPFKDGDLFEKPGTYTLTLTDKAGNSNTLSFEIKSLPGISDVVYTADCKALIDSIRSEFNNHNDLPEAYRTDIDNEIKALEDKYSELDKEVIEIKADTNTIEAKVEKLPNGTDGLISLQKEIQDEYNKIAGDTSSLTEEQKKASEAEAEYLKQQLNIIVTLQNQVDNIKTQVSSIDTKDYGLISQEGKISGILNDISKLTKEQQSILKPEIDLLNNLLDKIDTLKEQVETVKEMINDLPALDKITKQDSENINNTNKLYNELTNEQKELLGEDLIKQLNDTVEVLKKIMLYDADTDTTVTGIDGTSFTTDVYLVVTPIDKDTNAAGFETASDNVEAASKYISAVKGKELLALYDVSLFRDGIKIQPDGKVKVKIKIPEGLRNRTGLDIIHIADNGTVTPMNATVEGEYLVFITDHFSDYAIVAKTITKVIPKTGSSIDFSLLSAVGAIFILGGLLVLTLRRKKI